MTQLFDDAPGSPVMQSNGDAAQREPGTFIHVKSAKRFHPVI